MANVYGPYSMNKIQLGRESAFGTAVAASTIWRGAFAMLEDASTRVIVDEQVGVLVQAERAYDSAYLGKLSMPATELTFEQLPHILEAGILTATPGAGPGYSRAYAYPVDNSVPTPKSYTIETFNNAADSDMLEMEGSLVEEFTLEAQAGQAWKVSANWFGRQVLPTTPTSLSTLVAVEDAMLPKTALYLDATGGTIGTTQRLGVLMGVSIKVTTGLVAVPVGDGQLYHTTYKWTKPEITYSITFELQKDTVSVVAAERAFRKSGAVRLIQLTCSGSGATKSMVIKLAGKHDVVGNYENSNGNTTVRLDGHAVYSSADSLFFSITVVNGVATLP
jgi:hypothetical protein